MRRPTPFSEVYKHKGSNVAIFLGCGKSINKITEAQWRKISQFDTWTSNNFIYHDFIPKFYHVEIKRNKNFNTWKQWRKIKGKSYDKVIFIVKDHPKRKFLLEAVDIDRSRFVYGYHLKKINNRAKGIKPTYKIKNSHLTCNCNASFTMILEMLYKFEYKTVILFGVDMKDSRYFWSDMSVTVGGKGPRRTIKYKGMKVHCNTNKDHVPNQPHTTAHLVPYIIGFSNRYMESIGGKIYVGNKDTLLYPGLSYIDILEL